MMVSSSYEEKKAGGGPAHHIPVLLDAVVDGLALQSGHVICDGTFGNGGYTQALLERGCNVIAIDRDPDVQQQADLFTQRFGDAFRFERGCFSSLDVLSGQLLDGVVLDIGVSSMQIDQGDRGFSFRFDGPLDMRMSQSGLKASDVINTFSVGDLARIFSYLGEERYAGPVARMIERRRADNPFETTGDLAHAIEAMVPVSKKEKIHPATRVFQALRIYVNDELGELAKGLLAAERALKPGGILAVVTFHSLEDRMVKRFLNDRSKAPSVSRHLPEMAPPHLTFSNVRKPISADAQETLVNPRSRSAKLRLAKRLPFDVPERAGDTSIFGLPKLPSLESVNSEFDAL